MKSILPLLRQFMMPFCNWPWLYYAGLILLPLVLLTGLLYPRVAFGLAVWDFVLLLAIPFMLAPKILRALICNRRLALVPGFTTRVVLAALLFTLLLSSFLGFFSWLYAVPAMHLRNAMGLFVASSVYVVVMQYAVTTAGAMFALSLLPVTCLAAILLIMQSKGQWLLSDIHLAWLCVATLAGWLLAALHARSRHQFKPEHTSIENYKFSGYQRGPVAFWLLHGSNALADPDATLLLGYPATPITRLRVLLYLVFMGPVIGTAFLTAMGFGAQWAWRPSALDIFIGTSLLPAAFASFQNIEWVTRLRLIWLRRPTLRNQLWQLLEKQMLINLALLMLPCTLLMLCGLLFSQLSAMLLLHYPLLILLFNAFHAYYVFCARTSAWPSYPGLVIGIAGSALISGGVWVALAWHDTVPLIGLEALLMVGALKFRMMARDKLQSVDWLVVRPFRSGHAL